MMNQKRGLADSVSCPTMGANQLTEYPEQTKSTSSTPVGHATDKKLRPQTN